MRDSRPHHVAAALLLFLAAATPRPASAQLPEDRRTLTRPVSYAEMAAFLSSVNGKDPVTTSVEATTSGGRSVYLYGVYTDPRFRKLVTPGAAVPVWRVVMP